MKHGTRNGYRRHRAAGEEPCAECTQADREYQREWRRSRQDVISEQRRANRARDEERRRARLERIAREAKAREAAVTILISRHPHEFSEIKRDIDMAARRERLREANAQILAERKSA